MREELRTGCMDIQRGRGRDDAARLRRLLEAAWDWAMADRPEWATSTGYPKYHDRWTDCSEGAFARRREATALLIETLAAIDREKLSARDRLSYDLFLWRQEQDRARQRFPEELLGLNQMDGVQQDAARIVGLMPVETAAQRDAVLARLEGLPLLVEQTIGLLAQGLARGITPPREPLREVPRQVLIQIPAAAAEAPLLSVLRRLPTALSGAARERFCAQATALFAERVAPAFRGLHRFLEGSYLPGCRETVSWRDLPGGDDWYRTLIRYYTTSELTPDAVFETGMAEVGRIRGEMERIIAETGFAGDFAAFCEFLRTDPRFFCTSAEQLLSTYRDIAKRIDPELARLFGRLPQLPYGVIPIPPYAEKSQTTAYYQPGSLRAGRAGYFYANTYNLASRPTWEMEALTLHEAVPGHHLHIALMQEMEDLPEFRRYSWLEAYGEGWALYAESLGEEMGFYRDPNAEFGRLTYEMWRAIRLVVDPGLHARGWTRQQAIKFFRANSSKADHDIAVEIDRYIVWPGQAVSYKTGEMKIKALRRRAEERLGERFDIRAFHDELLAHGCLPLTVLEERMAGWLAGQEAPAAR